MPSLAHLSHPPSHHNIHRTESALLHYFHIWHFQVCFFCFLKSQPYSSVAFSVSLFFSISVLAWTKSSQQLDLPQPHMEQQCSPCAASCNYLKTLSCCLKQPVAVSSAFFSHDEPSEYCCCPILLSPSRSANVAAAPSTFLLENFVSSFFNCER